MSATSFHRGQFVRLTYGRHTVDARVMVVSSNGRALMLGFDGMLATPSGGAVFGALPVLRDEAGVYRDIVEDAPVTIEPRVLQ